MKTKFTFVFTFILFSAVAITTNAQNWSIHGNSGIDPNTDFIGTINNKALVFRTHNIECMRIKNNGSVGIGVQIPLKKLDINGNINIATDSALYFGNWKILSVPGLSSTSFGFGALPASSNGQENTAIGSDALNQLHTGSWNTAVGGSTLIITKSGSGNTALGYFATTDNGSTNSMALGYHSETSANNQVRVGDFNITSIGGVVDWSVASDARVKKNIKSKVPGLAFINKLNPVTYNLDLDAVDKFMNRSAIKTLDGKTIQPSAEDIAAKKLQEQITYTGFIAQDVEKVAKSLSYDFSGVDAAKNDKDLYGLRYGQFVVPLVKAVQELSKLNDDKDAAIQQQNKKIDNLQKQIDELKTMIASSTNNQNAISISSSASLLQNTPNPFSNSTIINYVLPTNYSSAHIIITDKNGNTLKQIKLTSKGKESLTVDGATLSSGAYSYALYVNNKLVGSKQMDYLK